MSTDGVNWFSALVLTFDSAAAATGTATDWNRTQTIYVRAQAGSVPSDATIELMHSILSTTGFSQRDRRLHRDPDHQRRRPRHRRRPAGLDRDHAGRAGCT